MLSGIRRSAVSSAAKAAASFLIMLALVAVPATAHPHVSISVRTILLVEGGAVTGLHHIWLMDEAWLATQLEEHDKDKDGKLSTEELEGIAKESRSTLDIFKSFTTIRHGNQRIRPGAPGPVKIDYLGDLLGLSFTVPLPKPIPLAGADLLLEVFDATYFSNFAFAGEDAVSFAGEQPAGCSVAMAAASPQQMAAYRMTARQFGEDFTKAVTPRATAVKCPAGGITPVSAR